MTRKLRLISKFMYLTGWETNNVNAHMPNISRSKSNQAMKFVQLIEYNIFLKNDTQNLVGKLVPDPFTKSQS